MINKKVIDDNESNITDHFLRLCDLDVCENCQLMQAIGYQHENIVYQIEFFEKGSETILIKNNHVGGKSQ